MAVDVVSDLAMGDYREGGGAAFRSVIRSSTECLSPEPCGYGQNRASTAPMMAQPNTA